MAPRYLTRNNFQGLVVPIGATPAGGTFTGRTHTVSRIRVPAGQARSWRVVLQPMVFVEPGAGGVIVDTAAGQPAKATAVVKFGADGVLNTAIVDYPLTGGMFTVWGDSVEVSAVIPNEWTASATPASVTVGALTVPSDGATMRATRTIYSESPGNKVASPLFAVPSFARSMRWLPLVTNYPTALWLTGFMDRVGGFPTFRTPEGNLSTDPQTYPTDEGMPIDSQTRFMSWAHNHFAPLGMQMSFVLDLG